MDSKSYIDADPYMRVVLAFDRDETANSFLSEDGEGGMAAGVFRMAEEIRRLKAQVSCRHSHGRVVDGRWQCSKCGHRGREVTQSSRELSVMDSKNNITPGPWVHNTNLKSNGDWPIAECFGPHKEANALAISKLPDLIKAAEDLLASNQLGHWDALKHAQARDNLRSILLSIKGDQS